MKIVLAAQNSSYTHTNSAVRILAAALRSHGHTVKIIETTVNDRGGNGPLCEKLYAEKADLYGFSVYIWNRAVQLSAAKMIKELIPLCTTVIGGPEVSFEDRSFMADNPYIDYLIRGEGENAICDIADGKYQKGSIVDGVSDDFENTPEPYFSHPFSEDTEESVCGKLVYYESSRGCPFNCSYCLSSVKRRGEKLRTKAPETVLSEVKKLGEHGIKTIKFVDRTFNADVSRAKIILRGLIEQSAKKTQNGVYTGATHHFEMCASLIDDETVEILSQAPKNLFQLEIGVQTVNKKTLEAIGRGDDTEKILKNVKKLRDKTDIHIHLDLICGLPYDDVESIAGAFDRIYGLCDHLQLGFLKLLHGTKMRAEHEKYGMVFSDLPPYNVVRTNTVSFPEMRMLERTSDALDCFSEEKSGFRGTIGYMLENIPSAFLLFRTLGEHFFCKNAVTRKKMYSEMLLLCREMLSDETQKNYVKEHLRLDYLLCNQGACPACIEREYTEDEKKLLEAYKTELVRSFDRRSPEMFIPALETHLFLFDEGKIYAIDRKNGVYKTVTPAANNI